MNLLKKFYDLFSKNVKETNVRNDKSNNIKNLGELTMAGINYGNKEVNAPEVIISNTGNGAIFNVHINSEENNSDKLTPLTMEIEKIKKTPNYYSRKDSIDKFTNLLNFNVSNITKEDQFEIIINLLIIYVNLHDTNRIEEYIRNIDNLKYKDEKRIAKVISVYYFNIGEFKKVEEILSKYEILQSDLLQYVIKLSAKCINGEITYSEFKEKFLLDNELKEDFIHDDSSNLYKIIGYTAREKSEYNDFVKFSEKALKISQDSKTKMNLATAYYVYAIKDSIENKRITGNIVYYEELIKSKILVEEVIASSEKDKDNELFEYAIRILVSILSLLGNIDDAINTLKNLGFEHKNEELKETQNILEYIFKNKDLNNINSLDESDILMRDIYKLLADDENNRSEVINRLENTIWDRHKNNINLHCILLESYLKTGQTDEFIMHLKKVDELGKKSNLILKVKYQYYCQIKDNNKAEECLLESINKYTDPDSYYNLLVLYSTYSDAKFKQLIDRILSKDIFVLEVLYESIYNIYFEWLLKRNMFLKAREAFEKCDKDKFGIVNYTNNGSAIYAEIGEHQLAVQIYKEGYKETKSVNYLYGLSCSYIRCNEFKKAKESLNKLLKSDFSNKEVIYVMLSNIEVLDNNLEESFVYAEKAKEIVKDMPKSDIHSFYVARSMRCNKIDLGVIHMNNFIESYPKINDWVRPIRAIEEDSNGNKFLTDEMDNFFRRLSSDFNKKLKGLKSGIVGMANISKFSGQMYNQIFSWKELYNVKFMVNSGNLKELNKELLINTNEIIIDAIGLYVLSDINELTLLERFKNVYITYSTLEYLNLMLLHNEDAKVRNIIIFMSRNLNVKIVPMNYKLYNIFDCRENDIFDEYILDSMCYAKKNNIVYYYGEIIVQKIADYNKIKSIGIMSLLKKEQFDYRVKVKSKLIAANYTFINFNYKEMYHCSRINGFKKCKEIVCFFDIDKHGDLLTFIIQYIRFIYIIYKKHNQYFDDMYELFIKSMSRVYNKTIYSEVMIKTLSKKAREQDENILSEENIKKIQENVIYAIQCSFYFFSDKKEFEYYFDFISNIVNFELINKILVPIKSLNGQNVIKILDQEIKELSF